MMADAKTVKTLVTGVLNDDDAEIARIVEACLESRYKSGLKRAQRAVVEAIMAKQKPVLG